ncbi:MAG: cupin domain-containing protein [Alphaproteobacteria bacterium]|nr:cupin domain-containing protein [Alphaproteobacteria bacterium]
MTPAWLIDRFGMQPHPEGGHYVETFRDAPEGGGRGAMTCIHFLLQAGEVSAWHRIDATEIWHFAAGDPLVLTLSADGCNAKARHLGPDLETGQHAHVVVSRDCWQTATSLGAWTLVSCIVAPAFAFAGFEMAPPDWRPRACPPQSAPHSTIKGPISC